MCSHEQLHTINSPAAPGSLTQKGWFHLLTDAGKALPRDDSKSCILHLEKMKLKKKNYKNDQQKAVKLGGSSNPSFPLESCVTSEQKSLPVPGVCSPICKRYPPRGVLVNFGKCFAQQLAQSKHLETVSFTPGLIRPPPSPLERKRHEGGEWEN